MFVPNVLKIFSDDSAKAQVQQHFFLLCLSHIQGNVIDHDLKKIHSSYGTLKYVFQFSIYSLHHGRYLLFYQPLAREHYALMKYLTRYHYDLCNEIITLVFISKYKIKDSIQFFIEIFENWRNILITKFFFPLFSVVFRQQFAYIGNFISQANLRKVIKI